MQTITLNKTSEIKRTKKDLEKKLNVKLSLVGKQLSIEGDSFNTYEAQLVLEAIDLGFSTDKALLLKNEDFVFRKIHIKDHTRRKNLEEVRGRIIGTRGKTKKTLESLTDSHIVIDDNFVSVISPSANIEEATTAITNIIRGTKQTNAYKFLEKLNQKDFQNDSEDLGLKEDPEEPDQ
tara:strand:- start:63 stop:596 length:534 start_codon:yes stop_codon:yes gene_type:complete